MRLAAIGDIHCNKTSHDILQPLFSQVAQSADILLLCGDLVDYGLPEEAAILAKELNNLKIPILAVLGNHEFESGKQDAFRVERVCQMHEQVFRGKDCAAAYFIEDDIPKDYGDNTG